MIIAVSYNARYAKLREVKKAHFPDFWRFSPGWLIFRLDSTALQILHFLSYFIFDCFICLTLSDALRVMRCFIGSFAIHFISVSIYALAL